MYLIKYLVSICFLVNQRTAGFEILPGNEAHEISVTALSLDQHNIRYDGHKAMVYIGERAQPTTEIKVRNERQPGVVRRHCLCRRTISPEHVDIRATMLKSDIERAKRALVALATVKITKGGVDLRDTSSMMPKSDSKLMQDVIHELNNLDWAEIESHSCDHVLEVAEQIDELTAEKRIEEAKRLAAPLAEWWKWSLKLRKRHAAMGNEFRAARQKYRWKEKSDYWITRRSVPYGIY